MKRLLFVFLFISVNVLFIVLQIHKNGKINEISYHIQDKQRELDALGRQKEARDHQLQALKNPGAVKDYARKHLQMDNVRLSQVKRITSADGA